MKIIRSIEEIPFDSNTVITIGTFDGVHLAHQKIINEVVTQAKKHNCRSVIITFDPHPREIIVDSKSDIKLLTTLQERQEICEKYGIDVFIILTFDRTFAQQSYHDFYNKYLVCGIGVRIVIEGYDHHWGKNREGNIESLIKIGKEFGFDVVSVEPITLDGITLKSSIIRNELYEGNVNNAARYLGRPYRLRGKVIKGAGRGRLLGYPTANIELDSVKKLVPKNGIYFVRVHFEENTYFGITSIGVRPTFQAKGKRTIEVYILDFDKDIYGCSIGIDFLSRLRDELKFDSTDKLIQQMNEDKKLSCILQLEYLNK
jgi:riboflavin kinase/FMN adenylyltransferase